jgi:DNA integrity scanning protein DisA with diadenylate cyclase activity/mannitol/fructose-specific phosphotransferase system IIA component (Ntr-type)
MRLDKYISKARVIDLKSRDLKGALAELVHVTAPRLNLGISEEMLVENLIQRENTMTTCLGNAVAMPHIRVAMKRDYVFAIGRCVEGIEYEGLHDYTEVRLVVLLLASDRGSNYLNVLSSLARLFREQSSVDHIVNAETFEEYQLRVTLCFGGLLAKPDLVQNQFNRLMLSQAEKVAKASRCASLMVFSDTFAGGIEVTDCFPKYPTLLVSRNSTDRFSHASHITATLEVRSFSRQRLSQLRSAIIMGLTRGLLKANDRICCVGGIPASNQLDAMVVVDIEQEFQSVLARDNNLLPAGVKIEVIERMIGVATELALEGREGHPVGSLFVIGDHEKVNTMVKPLVLNPFYGYKEEDKNVLNPFMDETLKEFSVIDGCFVIRGNGVIESAGSLIHAASEYYQSMPGGLGSRHSAGSAISRAADCLAIAVSASTGQVTLFRRGVMIPLLEKPLGSNV